MFLAPDLTLLVFADSGAGLHPVRGQSQELQGQEPARPCT